jgi:hypothetical protein
MEARQVWTADEREGVEFFNRNDRILLRRAFGRVERRDSNFFTTDPWGGVWCRGTLSGKTRYTAIPPSAPSGTTKALQTRYRAATRLTWLK